MERLQKALEQARVHRAQAVPLADEGVAGKFSAQTGASAPAPETSVESAWNALERCTLDERVLAENLMVSKRAQQTATPFDILRTKTQLMMRKNKWSRLGITSPTAGCGKTTLACNLALGFTRQADLRVILIEMDLRRPSMARVLGIQPERDVAEVMIGTIDFAQQAFRLGDNVAVAIARRPEADPAAVFLSQKTQTVLAEIEQMYQPDLLIFDLPPVLVGDDTRAFLKQVDCALIVAKAEATSVSQIDVCEREVAEQTNVLGVVLNQCRHVTDTDYGYESYGSGS